MAEGRELFSWIRLWFYASIVDVWCLYLPTSASVSVDVDCHGCYWPCRKMTISYAYNIFHSGSVFGIISFEISQFCGKNKDVICNAYANTAEPPISTASTDRAAFHNTKSTVYSLYFGKFYKSTTSLNGPHEFTAAGGRFREVLLYIASQLTYFLLVAEHFNPLALSRTEHINT